MDSMNALHELFTALRSIERGQRVVLVVVSQAFLNELTSCLQTEQIASLQSGKAPVVVGDVERFKLVCETTYCQKGRVLAVGQEIDICEHNLIPDGHYRVMQVEHDKDTDVFWIGLKGPASSIRYTWNNLADCYIPWNEANILPAVEIQYPVKESQNNERV